MLMNPEGLAMTAAAVAAAGIFVWASKFRPKIQPFVPLVIAAGILGAAVYAEVPFERSSTQNQMLVSESVVDASDSGSATLAAAPMSTPAAPSATRHATAELRGIDHTASGTVSVIESATGAWVVRFDDYKVQFSPEPVLYLLNEADARKPGGTKLGAFTATNGDLLDVALPDGVRPGAGWTVLIWCEKFRTPIANAALL